MKAFNLKSLYALTVLSVSLFVGCATKELQTENKNAPSRTNSGIGLPEGSNQKNPSSNEKKLSQESKTSQPKVDDLPSKSHKDGDSDLTRIKNPISQKIEKVEDNDFNEKDAESLSKGFENISDATETKPSKNEKDEIINPTEKEKEIGINVPQDKKEYNENEISKKLRENPANTPNEDDVADKNVLLLKENHEVEKRGTKSAQNEPEKTPEGRRVNILENHTSDELITPITKKPFQELPSNYPPPNSHHSSSSLGGESKNSYPEEPSGDSREIGLKERTSDKKNNKSADSSSIFLTPLKKEKESELQSIIQVGFNDSDHKKDTQEKNRVMKVETRNSEDEKKGSVRKIYSEKQLQHQEEKPLSTKEPKINLHISTRDGIVENRGGLIREIGYSDPDPIPPLVLKKESSQVDIGTVEKAPGKDLSKLKGFFSDQKSSDRVGTQNRIERNYNALRKWVPEGTESNRSKSIKVPQSKKFLRASEWIRQKGRVNNDK